jgi:hypothetical protein
LFSINLTAISFIFLSFISLSSALVINEIELNPLGSDSGKEWIELYSKEKISLSDYYLENEDGDIYKLSGDLQGYLIINFEKQWLDNSKAIIYIKKNNQTVFQTKELEDLKNNDLTLNLCDSEYILKEKTKNSDNNCSENKVKEEVKNNQTIKSDSNERIFLNKQQDKIIYSKDYKIRLYFAYFFAFLSIIILALIYLRKL